jgi:hypothetical protein
MNKEIIYEVSYEVAASIRYLGEENPGEYFFSIIRQWADTIFGDEEDEAVAIINKKGEVEIEAYDGYIRDEEASAIGKMLEEIRGSLPTTN